MADPLKEIFDRKRFAQIAKALQAVYPAVDVKRFVAIATNDLDGLSVMQRLRRTAEALHAVLPGGFDKNVAILKRLAPKLDSGFVAMALPEYVALYGEGHFDTALDALAHFTGYGSAEFAIRYFLQKDLARTLAVMERWAKHESEHVRRLASEGSRPRLPWAARLPRLMKEPHHTLVILEALKADPSPMVRRSVANHLNDITKDNPAWVIKRLKSWPNTDRGTVGIVKHALRSLIKAGDASALALIGAGAAARVRVADFSVSPRRIKLGGRMMLSARIISTSPKPQRLVIDNAIHYVKQNGSSRKVFKLKELTLASKAAVNIERSQVIKNFTTRVHYAGRHQVELLVNGACLAKGAFELIT